MSMIITSRPDPDYPDPANRHLWLLVGDADYYDGAYAFYLGADRDIDGVPIAENKINSVIQSAKSKGITLDRSAIRKTLDDYRND